MHASRFLLTLAVLIVVSSASLAELREADLVAAIKNSKSSILESGLPSISIEDWVIKRFEKGSEAKWEVNDCGEGWHINDPRTPVCVEIQIPQKNGYVLHINTIIKIGAEQKVSEPQIWLIYFFKSENYKTIDVVDVKTIKEAVLLYQENLESK